jgi:glutaconate CoA-transferase, subunit B
VVTTIDSTRRADGATDQATPSEVMTIVAARSLQDGDVCFVGIGAPSAACNLARLTHAPNLVLIYESGTLQARPEILPLSIGDGELCETALATVSVPELFRYWLQGRRISKGFLGGAQVDRFANINSTVIGSYDGPKVRLPGGGGAPEIAASCGEVMITAKHSPRVFVDRVDFVTSLGHGGGPGSRMEAGLTTAGPTQVITDLAVLEPGPETRELVVTSLHPGVTREQVVDATGWQVRFAAGLGTTPAPTDEELSVLRDLHARTEAAHRG